MSMRMRQSLADIDQAMAEHMERERLRQERLTKAAEQRSRRRALERHEKRGSMRFALLVLSLIATAVVVTIVMFETLYAVMG